MFHGGDGACDPLHQPPVGSMPPTSPVASSSASVDECAIAKEVLGERRGHVCAVGWVPKDTSPSHHHSIFLGPLLAKPPGQIRPLHRKPHEEHTISSLEISKIMIFGLQCMKLSCAEWRMERTIQRFTANLKHSIPKVLPEEEEDEDDGGRLGICRFYM
ncbi:Uncharacterized protein Adt_40130 [Abeliophyllum distichum]|uniref:Uncharacterized protein n=1 Tax=Abeliophyllum distichum TaxID=126358 RepID=A0ABD1Q722_9LAMI